MTVSVRSPLIVPGNHTGCPLLFVSLVDWCFQIQTLTIYWYDLLIVLHTLWPHYITYSSLDGSCRQLGSFIGQRIESSKAAHLAIWKWHQNLIQTIAILHLQFVFCLQSTFVWQLWPFCVWWNPISDQPEIAFLRLLSTLFFYQFLLSHSLGIKLKCNGKEKKHGGGP